jgi:hypothetical protein
MNTHNFDRMAAWLLTLPGPFSVCDLASAEREAQKEFDPTITQDEFSTSLAKLGYTIKPVRGSDFAILND